MALGKTASELLHDCTGPELVEWAAYLDIEPPDEQDDWRMAQICSTMAQLKGSRLKARDFMPRKRLRRQTAEEQFNILRSHGQ